MAEVTERNPPPLILPVKWLPLKSMLPSRCAVQNPIADKNVAIQLDDTTVDELIATRKQGRIWGANIGEWGGTITPDAYQRLTYATPATMLGCMYISEPKICGLHEEQRQHVIDLTGRSREEKWTDEFWDSEFDTIGQVEKMIVVGSTEQYMV
eukprot:COSAG02_NODE_265_length_26599_cov_13.943698_16_plen_153_part_00